MYTNFCTHWTKISGSLEPRSSKILGNLPVKSVFGACAPTHVRALVCNELVIKMLTICKKINPLTSGVRAAGGLKKSFETYFPMNSPNWEHGPTLTDLILIKIFKRKF